MAADQRPIIPGFHPDPSICKVGDYYYIATSSFEYGPGCPLFRSSDLLEWKLVGNVLDRSSQLALPSEPSTGIFAPTLRYHDGRYWLITTNLSDGGGQILVSSDRPEGPWTDPIRFPAILGIDPDLAWDESGNCYCTYARRGRILQVRINLKTGDVLSEPRALWSGTGGKFPEAPHLYQRDDFWYLLIAEGGTERGHAVSIARGRSPEGPFEGSPDNPIATRRGTDSNVQSTGHADIADISENESVIVYLGTRPRGGSPEWHVLGRETFASRLTWKDGWPKVGDPIESVDAPTSRHYTEWSTPLGPEWVAPGCFPRDIATATQAGLQLGPAEPGRDTFLGLRQEHFQVSVRADLTISGVGGIAIRIDEGHQFWVKGSLRRTRVGIRIGGRDIELASAELQSGVVFEVQTRDADGDFFSAGRGPDLLIGGYRLNDHFVEMARFDGRYVSTEVAGGMTGRTIGVFCESGSVVVHQISYIGKSS